MLARPGPPARDLDAGILEVKFDGWRLQTAVSSDLSHGIRATTRSGRDITASLPELAPLADAGVNMVLDGEVVFAAGRSDDFYRVAATLARRRRPPGAVSVVVFDLLWLEGHDITALPWTQRRRLLEQVPLTAPVTVSTVFDAADTAELLAVCDQMGVEGGIWKRRLAPYEPGVRSGSWRKLKTTQWTALHAPKRIDARR